MNREETNGYRRKNPLQIRRKESRGDGVESCDACCALLGSFDVVEKWPSQMTVEIAVIVRTHPTPRQVGLGNKRGYCLAAGSHVLSLHHDYS